MFVVQPPLTKDGCIVLASNSHRPMSEVQEVIHLPAADHVKDAQLHCTYIDIEQVDHTHTVVLSRPSWMWGAEMGVNEKGVTVVTSAVWTNLNSAQDLDEKLLASDLVRLALERSLTSREALNVVTSLIGKYGQGGPCSDTPGLTSWAHHSSYLMADGSEVWLLETAGALWAARRVTEPVMYIKNELLITTDMDETSPDLDKRLSELGFYDGQSPLNFSQIISLPSSDSSKCRGQQGRQHLNDLINNGVVINAKEMFHVLRQEASADCVGSILAVTSSLVSALQPPTSLTPSSHWFTGTPNPCLSMFKPIIFTAALKLGDETRSPGDAACAGKGVDRRHPLYAAHERLCDVVEDGDERARSTMENIRALESNCYQDICDIADDFTERNAAGVSEIFTHMCTLEVNFYRF